MGDAMPGCRHQDASEGDERFTGWLRKTRSAGAYRGKIKELNKPVVDSG